MNWGFLDDRFLDDNGGILIGPDGKPDYGPQEPKPPKQG